EILRIIQRKRKEKVLIVVPLGVRQEFVRDGKKLGVDFVFIRKNEEIQANRDFYLTNYESVRDGKLDPNLFGAVSLDEAGVLRSYGSKTYQTFLTLFEQVSYKFVATATPSPNRYKELIHYAGFLGIMDTGQALTRFFQRDSTKANQLTLFPHKEKEFYLWMASWAVFVQKPSDLGYSDDGYILPTLKVHRHEIPTNHKAAKSEKDGQSRLFVDINMSLSAAAAEKRSTLPDRVAKMKDIVEADPKDHFIIWHDLEDERRAIKKALPDAVEVYGSLDLDTREQRIIDFSDGKFKYLATKPILSGSGCNFQRHCHKAIFLGIGFKFHDFIQSVHRIQRFLQTKTVEIHLIYSEAEHEVLKVLEDKWKNHDAMANKMSELIRKNGLNLLDADFALTRSMGVERVEFCGENWKAVNNDCVVETQNMGSDSIDLAVTSIPFSNHYEYTPSYNDFGHTQNNDHFWEQMDFLAPELLRVMKPGRVFCCHVKDRILFGNVTGTGFPTVSPFHAEAIFHYQKHGFKFIGMITVVTDVVRENNQTYRLGWTENCKDGSKMGVGSPEYVLLFRKQQTEKGKAYADVPVKKSKSEYSRSRWQVDAHAFWRSSGNRQLTVDEMSGYRPDTLAKLFTKQSLEKIYNFEDHVQLGENLDNAGSLPSSFMALAPGSHLDDVWHDVTRMRNLNGEQARRGLANHVCPLQFDIVDRLI
ncbi:MAG: DNA methylase N-4, partial [bacterium]